MAIIYCEGKMHSTPFCSKLKIHISNEKPLALYGGLVFSQGFSPNTSPQVGRMFMETMKKCMKTQKNAPGTRTKLPSRNV